MILNTGRHNMRRQNRREFRRINIRKLYPIWMRIVAGLAAVIIFCTTYAMILPASALTGDRAKEMSGFAPDENVSLTSSDVIELAEAELPPDDGAALEAMDPSGGDEGRLAAEDKALPLDISGVEGGSPGEDQILPMVVSGKEETGSIEEDKNLPVEISDGDGGGSPGDDEALPAETSGSSSVEIPRESTASEDSTGKNTNNDGSRSSDSGEKGAEEIVVSGDSSSAEEQSQEAELQPDDVDIKEDELPEEEKLEEFKAGVLEKKGDGYHITVTYGASAKIPENASLDVREIEPESEEYEKLIGQMNEERPELRADQNQSAEQSVRRVTRLFDITIKGSDGGKVEPEDLVDVKISLPELGAVTEKDEVELLHFDKQVDSIDASLTDETLTFETEGFSVYGVSYTVDFEYTDPTTGNVYTYSIKGGSKVRLSELFGILGAKYALHAAEATEGEGQETAVSGAELLAHVTDVKFSAPELVKVTKIENSGAETGAAAVPTDWELESLAAFDTEESLTITMDDGNTILIKVTDDKVYAVQITKILVDENGNRIRPGTELSFSFNVYGNPDGTADSVKDLNVGSWQQDPDYSNYQDPHQIDVRVDETGMGNIYDYDVTAPALYYIEEDKESIAQSITDITGHQWSFKEAYFLTEYAWRDHPNDNYMHVSKNYQGTEAFRSVPEILGDHPDYNGAGNYTNDYLEIYAYNVYEAPEVDVPVIKTWPDFDGAEYDWSASFKLQWAPVYPGESAPTTGFEDVVPLRSMTITKDQMADPEASLNDRTFYDLPKYGTDDDGNTFRYQYSLEETSYSVSRNGTVLYTWDEVQGYNTDDEDTHYQAFYPHDAGENESGKTEEQNASDENYYIDVRNAKRNISEKEYINVSLDKQWGEYPFDERAESYYAEFELRRFMHTEHRDLSHMLEEDRLAAPVTITVKDAGGHILDRLSVQPNVGLYAAGNFAPHDGDRTITFSISPAAKTADGQEISSTTATAAGSNMSNAIVRSQEFFVTQDTVITLTDGAEHLAPGDRSARILDTSAGTNPLPDKSFVQTVRLESENGWHYDFSNLIHSTTSAGDDDGNENVTYYEYYLVEKEGSPEGYAQYYRLDDAGQPTEVLSGDSDHRIEGDEAVVAVNGPRNRLIVKKLWRGAPDTTGFPTVHFTLYQTWADDQNGNGWVYEENGERYEHIELKGNSAEWICPVVLPQSRLDGSVSRAVKYYVLEDEGDRTGSWTDGGITTSWKFYYYLNSNGKQYNAGHQGYQVALTGEELFDDGGSITICNALDKYIQMDIQKQFFELGPAGSWGNTTAQRARSTVLGFKVIRAVKTSKGKWLDDNGNESDTPVWSDYSEEMLCGYDENGAKVVDRGEDSLFWLWGVGNTWEFRIENNWGDVTDVSAGGSGLPSYGFFIKNGENIPVEYWYSYRETNVYKDINKTPYPEWEWFSSVTPVWAYGPNQEKLEAFPKAFAGQDPMRVANFQASDLVVHKEWIGDVSADEVYVKVWRTKGEGGTPEDFTAVIAEDIRNNNNWQMYVNDAGLIDVNHAWLVLKNDGTEDWTAALKVNRALYGEQAETGTYHYYIQEVGYKTTDGVVRTNVNAKYKPLYDRVVDGNWTDAPVGMNDYASNSIKIGAKGENHLKVINRSTPSTSYTVTKAFSGSQSSTGGHSSVTGRYPTDGSPQVVVELQQRYRYEKVEGDVAYVSKNGTEWVRADSEDAPNTWTVDWQGAESANPTSVVLPRPKPAGSSLSDEAWYSGSAAWTYTWEGLDVQKVVSEDADPTKSKIAQLYYRAVETSTPDWLNQFISDEEKDGHKAVDDDEQTDVQILGEKNNVINEQQQLDLNLNKEWSGLGEGQNWPEGYIVYYQLIQDCHLALTDVSAEEVREDGMTYIKPAYSYSGKIKSIGMSTTSADAATADSVHPQATGTLEKNNHNLKITGLPAYGFITASADDVENAAAIGIQLKEGTVYPVVYTYSAKETAVKKNGTDVSFREQTVEAEKKETEEGTVYEATLKNELKELTVKKDWNGLTPGSNESATIKLYRFEKEPDPVPETTFPVKVSVDEWGTGIDASNDGHVTVTFSADGEESISLVLQKPAWEGTVNLPRGASWNATYAGDNEVIDSNVVLLSGTTQNITPDNADDIKLKANKKESAITVRVYVNSAYYNTNNGNNWGGNVQVSEMTDGYLSFVIKDPSNGNAIVYENGNLNSDNGWSQSGITLPRKDSEQYVVEFTGDGSKVIRADNSYINISGSEQSNYESGTRAQYTDPNMEPDADGTVRISGGNISQKAVLNPGHTYKVLFTYSAGYNAVSITDGTNRLFDYAEGIGNDQAVWGFQGSVEFWFELSVPETGTTNLTIEGHPYGIIGNFRFEEQRTAGRAARPSATKAVLMANQLTAPAKAPASITWTNDKSTLPVGADPDEDECIDTIVFSGTTWSKTWEDLPKYSEEGKEYVYYAYETDYQGASGATEMYTSYSVDENGNITVTNTPTYPNLGNLKVEKEVFYDSSRDLAAQGLSFVVRIFSDAAGTVPVAGQDKKTINVTDGYGDVTFSGLAAGTYYVYEIVNDSPVTKSGTEVTIDGTKYTASYTVIPAEVTAGRTATATIINTKKPFDLNLLKKDEDDTTKTLDGAEFTLNKLTYDPETGTISYEDGTEKKVTTKDGGKAAFTSLALGYYEIKETKAPDGYVLTTDSTFYIRVTSSGVDLIIRDNSKAPAEWETSDGSGKVTFEADPEAKTYTATVANEPGEALPSTGGPGTRLFKILGLAMMLGAGVMLFRRRSLI